MNHIDNSDLKFMSATEIKNEIISARKIHKKMNDQLMELKVKASKHVVAENRCLKKERECEMLSMIVCNKDSAIEKLKEELHDMCDKFENERDQRVVLEKRIAEMSDKCRKLEHAKNIETFKKNELFNLAFPNNEHLTENEKRTLPELVRDLKVYLNDAYDKINDQFRELQQIDSELTETKRKLLDITKTANHQTSQAETYKQKYEEYVQRYKELFDKATKCRNDAYHDRRETEMLRKDIKTVREVLDDTHNSLNKLTEEKQTLTQLISLKKHEIEKLQKRNREITTETEAKDKEIVDLKNLVSEFKNKIRLLELPATAQRVEKDLILDNLFRAQEQIHLTDKTIQQLKDEIRDQSCEIKAKESELSTIINERNSIRRQMEETKRRLTKLKKAQKIESSIVEELPIMKEKWPEMAPEDNVLEELLVNMEELTSLQNDFQSAKEQIVKYMDDIQLLKQENKTLKHDLYISDKRREKIRNRIRRDPSNLQMMDIQSQEIAQTKCLLKEKDRKIEELMEMLGWLPNDTVVKFQMCKWDIRDLNKKLISSNASAKAYNDLFNKEREKNKLLTEELRKLKLENGDPTRYSCLPPIQTKAKSLPEDTSKDKSQQQTAPKSKPDSPPSELNCHAVQIMPQPPPTKKKSQKIESKPPEDTLNSSKVGEEICKEEEKSNTLANEPRSVKMSADSSRYTRLPPIQTKVKSLADGMPKDKCESGHTSRHRRFPLTSATSRPASARESKPDFPPSEFNRHAIQIMPQPPPTKKMEVKSTRRTLKRSAQIKNRDHPVKVSTS